MTIFEQIIYFIIGILPCILWLLFYLKQDVHPESNKKILEIFLWGVLITFPIFFIEKQFTEPINFTEKFLYYVFIIGLTEEFFKFIVVNFRAIKSSHFDEPIDAMLYLIIASLGLATVENLFAIFRIKILQDAIMVSIIRLLTAIFLHTLAAGITGFFLAYCLNEENLKKRFLIIAGGLLLSSFFHGIYDVSIVKLDNANNLFYFLLPIAIILLMGIFVYFLFLKVKKLPRSCDL